MPEPLEKESEPAPPDVAAFLEGIRSRRAGPHGYVVLLGLKPTDTPALLERLERGLSYRSFERFRRNIDLSMSELAELVYITARTLSRRKVRGRLEPAESDRLLRASRIFGKALELFEGDVEAARSWLSTPQRALGGSTPLAFARTEVGAREVEDLIGRLEHGIFS